MTEELLKWFKLKGMEYVCLEVEARNKLGLKVWNRLGFKTFLENMKMKI